MHPRTRYATICAAFFWIIALGTAFPVWAQAPPLVKGQAYYQTGFSGNLVCTSSLPDPVGACKFNFYHTGACANWLVPTPSYNCKDPSYPGYDFTSDGCVGINFCVVNFSVLRKHNYQGPECATGFIDKDGQCTNPPPGFAPGATTTDDAMMCSPGVEASAPTSKGNDNPGMCTANAHLAVVSLHLDDTPLGYTPAMGPPVYIRLSYNYQEPMQPLNFTYFNVGRKWTLNVLSFIQDDSAAPGVNVTRVVGGGGFKTYSGYTGGSFAAEVQTAAVLTRTPASGAATSYTLTFANGAKHVFAKLDGSTSFPRRVFLTKIIDPQGLALTFNYTGLLLTSITDAVGRKTTLTYSGNQVTKITDPFGRQATLTYNNSRIATITDVIGLQSSFTYDTVDSGLIRTMTTPYGVSTFARGEDANGNRWLELTDPLGKTTRIESTTGVLSLALTPLNVPNGVTIAPGTFQLYNTFVWDRYVNTTFGHTDPGKATIFHWLVNASGQIASIGSMRKAPLENPVFFTYPGQTSPAQEGALGQPTAIGRVLEDGTTQLRQATYNALGKPLTLVDPLGRTLRFTYAANNVDVMLVEQLTASGYVPLARFGSYNTRHRPQSYTGADGQTWLYGWNLLGQLTSVTDPEGRTTRYLYDFQLNVPQVVPPLPNPRLSKSSLSR